MPPARSISASTSSSLSGERATSSGMPPAAAIFSAAARPMPLEAPVMTHRPAVDRALERAVLEQVGVEVALPVVPQLPGVASRARAPRCPSPPARAAVSRASNCAVERDVRRETSSGMPRSARNVRRTSRSAGSCISELSTPLGSSSVSACRSACASCGACAARAKVLSTSPARCGFGSTRWKACPSRPGWWAMWSIAAAT